MSGNQWFDSNPTGYGEHWFTPGDDPEQFAQQQLAQEQLSMPITEPDEPTDHYVPNPASASGHYMFSDPNWQLHHDPGYYQQPIQYSFLQDTIPPFDLEVSQPEIFEPVAISRPLPDQHDPGQSQAMERRLSLQPPQPQTPSAYNRERSASLTTPGWSSPSDTTQPGMISRTASPGAAEPEQYGYPVDNGLWKCSYPASSLQEVFLLLPQLSTSFKGRLFQQKGLRQARGEPQSLYSMFAPWLCQDIQQSGQHERSCKKNSRWAIAEDKAGHELMISDLVHAPMCILYSWSVGAS
ncbi:hypothetical protein MBLNU457_g2781t1 [Dothideomycetes sp. NU457]